VPRRNAFVLTAVFLILATFAWAGWANWEYRELAAERRAVQASAQAELVPDAGGDAPEYKSPLIGKPAPAFTLENLNGKEVSLADYKGKPLLLNFWATWCGPCKIETPWLIELRNKYAAQGFEVLGVDTEGDAVKMSDAAGWAKDKAAVQAFFGQEKVPYPILMGGDSIADPYGGLDALPVSFYVNRKGIVVAAQMGLRSESDMEADIRKALGE
jgi:cytochrome c biogenesis protein CcmG/thiol:disulfide interchange protein DsbE